MLWPYLFILTGTLLSRKAIGKVCSATRCIKPSGGAGIILCSCANNRDVFLPICSSDLWNIFSASAVCTELGIPGDGIIPQLMSVVNPDLSNGFLTIESAMCPSSYNIPFTQCALLNHHSADDPCPSNRYATVICSNPQGQYRNGDIKLVDFPKAYNIMGIIEVYGKSGFGTVCNHMFNDIAANVVCRELGFADGIFTSSALFRDRSSSSLPPIFYDNVTCLGNEAKLTHCSNGGYRIHDCNHEQDAAVICRDVNSLICSTGDLRLVGGASDGSSGRVETCLGGIWGTVCSNGWDDTDAQSICKSLGFNYGIASAAGGFGPGTGPIWFTDVDCSSPIGNGLSALCLLNTFIGMTDNCFHDSDAGVYCTSDYTGPPCDLVVNGFGYSGRLEVCGFDGFPASVCANSFEDFDDAAATVACASLGLTGTGYATSLGYFGQGSGAIRYSKVICDGTERLLEDCETELHDVNSCNHNQDVGIVCNDPSPAACNDGQLMLNFTRSSGLAQVLVCFSGVWGSICADHWDSYDGEVTCRQLGLPTQAITAGTIQFPSSALIAPLWLTDIDCVSFESSLVECLRAPLGVHRQDCITGGLAAISCTAQQCSQHSYRLVPSMSSTSFQDIDLSNLSSSDSPSFGRVEVCSNNEWISVCSMGFGDEEAMYICRDLGYATNDAMIIYVPEIDQGNSMKIVNFDVSCQNSGRMMCETSIIVSNVSVSGCQLMDVVGVVCNNDNIGESDAILIRAVTASSSAVFVLISILTIFVIVIIVCMRTRGNYSKHMSEDSNHNQQTFIEMNEYSSPNSESPSSLEYSHSKYAQRGYKGTYKLSQHETLTKTRSLSVSMEHLENLDDGIVIDSEYIRLMDCVGQGEYGVVYKAHLIAPSNKYEPKLVAVKTLKGQFSQTDVDSLMEETIRMKQFNHSNVLGLLGVCVDAGSAPYVVLPYMANGSLLDWLKRERSRIVLTKDEPTEEQMREIKKELLSISLQIVNGMHYLSLHKFIHRDLAARNCMMDEGNTIKVSDFGLSLDIYEKNYFRQEKGDGVKLPIKWMAIESMTDGVFSEKTDVWSFGVTCWEIFSGGKMPFGGLSPMGIPRMLEDGGRLDTPNNIACSTEIFSLMQDCWKHNPVERPSFSMLKLQLDTLLTPLADYIDFNAMDITGSQAGSTSTDGTGSAK